MSGSQRHTLESILHSYLQAVDRGERPDRQALLDAHPDLRDELAEYFADASKLEAVANSLKTAAYGEPSEASPSLGTIRYFGDYELLDEIARGGMGVVYRAKQVSLNRIVALKMILKGELASEADVRRFRQEAEAAANLDHPNIVPIYEVGEHEGQQYFSMKLIEPGERNAGLREVAATVAKVARAVHHAHQRGILHRDLKPSNILIDAANEPHVADFGLAKKVEGGDDATKSGAIVGTPVYMAPEQARAEKLLTTAVDVWSLGAILYEWLTGRPPFRGDDAISTLMLVVNDELAKPRSINAKIDRDLETICVKCLEKDPGKRYASAGALADDLDRWQRGEPIQARPVSRRERLAKWARREPAAAAFTAFSILFVICFLSVLTYSYFRIDSALDAELEAKNQAVNAAVQAQLREGEARAAQKSEAEARQQAAAHLEQAQSRLARFHVFRGNQQLSKGDPAGALQWFVEALKAEAARPDGGAVHRLRIALLLQDMPRLKLLLTHPSSLKATWNADGKELLTYHHNKVHRWDSQTGRLLQPPVEMQGNLSALGNFEGNGAYLLHETSRLVQQGGERPSERPWETTVRAWRTDNGAALGPPLVLTPLKPPPHVELLPSGPRLLILDRSERNPQLRLLDPANNKDVFPPVPLPGRVCGWSMTQDGKRLVLTTVPKAADNEVVAAYLSAWDLTNGKCVREPFAVQAAAERGDRSNPARVYPFVRPGYPGQPKRTEVLVAGHDEHAIATVQLWDLTDGKPRGPVVHVPAVHYGTPDTTGFRADGRFSYFLECGTMLQLRDPETGGRQAEFQAAGPVLKVQYNRDNFHLALIGRDFAQVIPVNRTDERWTVRDASLDQVSLHPNGRQLLCVHRDAELRLWTTPGERRTPALPRSGQTRKKPETARKWQLSPDGSKMIVLYSSPVKPYWSLQLRDVAADRPVGPRIAMEDFVKSWAVSPDNRHVATYRLQKEPADKDFDWPDTDRIIQLWDMVTGNPALPPFLVKGRFDRSPHRFFFTPDGRWLVAELYPGFRSHRMFAWDTATGKPLILPEAYDHIEFSPDGRFALTSLLDQYDPDNKKTTSPPDKDVRVWNLADRRLIARLALGAGSEVHSACFSADGQRILVSDFDHLTAWETTSGQRLHAPVACRGSFQLAFSPDGLHYLGQEGNYKIHVFAAATGRRVATLPLTEPPHQARFVAGGACVLTVTKKAAQAWDAVTGEPVGPPLPHSDDNYEAPLQLSQDGAWAFTRTSDNAWARIWDLRPDARALADLEALAQLLSGHRLNDLGLREPLPPEEVGRLWQRLQPRYPETLGPPVEK